jgi:hypothetical protein
MLLQQQSMGGSNQNNMQELQNLEEAFRYQEMELQKERENSNSLQIQLMQLEENGTKLKEKSDLSKKRLKKINDLMIQNKRQAGVLEQKVRESQQLKNQILQL